MSFSEAIKAELSRHYPESSCCARAELLGLLRTAGHLYILGNGGGNLEVSTEYPSVARHVFSILKDEFFVHSEVLFRKEKRLRRANVYLVRVKGRKALEIVERLGALTTAPLGSVSCRCCAMSFLKGSFLGGGSLSSPEKGYHLEIRLGTNDDTLRLAKQASELLDLKPAFLQKKDGFMLYIKESEQISDFLKAVGASSTLFHYEEVRVVKDLKGMVNRLVNCETANLNKAVEASLKQIEAIQAIEASVGLHSLPPKLRELAKLRLAHPDLTLKELGEKMNPKLGKSGVNHRMRQILNIARSYQ